MVSKPQKENIDIDEKLISLVVCTSCRSELKKSPQGVKCVKCGKEFKFEDGILIMD